MYESSKSQVDLLFSLNQHGKRGSALMHGTEENQTTSP